MIVKSWLVLPAALLLVSTGCEGLAQHNGRLDHGDVKYEVRISINGTSTSKNLVVDWHGVVPKFNRTVGQQWSRTYHVKGNSKVHVTVTNRTHDGTVTCIIYMNGIVIANRKKNSVVKCFAAI